MKRKFWSPAEYAALDARYPHERTDAIAKDLGRALKSVYAMASLRGLRKTAAYLASPDAHRLDGVKGMGTRFAKGLVPWNKGKAWDSGGRSHETRFTRGTIPPNRQAIGALRVSSDGVLDIKVRDGLRGWEPLSRWTWERERGPIPKGMAVRFRNGDPHDCQIDNLYLATRADLMRANTIHNYPKEVALAAQLVGALNRQINKRNRDGTKHRNAA
jgi:hypothetical protein